VTGLSPQRIMETGFGYASAKTLLSAIELELFTRLAQGPLDRDAIQEQLQLHPRSVRDFLDALVVLGFLEREGDVYRNSPEADHYLDKRKPSYIGGILEMANQRLYPFWGRLTEALKTGKPQNEAADGDPDFFRAIYADPQRLRQFLTSMSGLSREANRQIARRIPWSQYKSFVDVGTAQGDLAVQIALANPHMEGMGFDLPQVGPIFNEYITGQGVADRVRFVEGSFFEQPIPQADVVLMGHILHDWGMDDKRMLIRKAYDALPPGGLYVIYEALIDDDREKNAFGLLMSLNMLIETTAGFDYTGAECSEWLQEVGFRETRVEHLIGNDWMIVGVK